MNEDQREKLQLFLTRLRSISPTRWIVSISAIIVISIVFSIWNQYGFVYVSIPAGIDNKTPIKYSNSDDSQQSLMNIGSLVVVPRANSALSASTDKYNSVVSVSIPWFGFTSVNLPTSTTAGIEKYTINSPGCANYDTEKDRLINYKCQSPLDFSTIDLQTGSSQTLTPLLSTNQSAPFLSGILGISDSATSQLFYQDYSGTVSYIKNPDGLSSSDLSLAQIITNHNDITSTSFILLPLSGDIYIGNYTNNTVSYNKISRPSKWTTEMSSICQLLMTSAYCYQGISGAAPSGSDVTSSSDTGGSLLKINISSPGNLTLERYGIDSEITADGIFIANDGNLTLTDGGRIYNFSFSGSRVVARQLSGNIKSVATTGSSIYFVKDNTIYKLQKNAATAIFHSDNISIARIFTDNGSVFLTARSADNGTDLSIYKLTETPDTTTSLLLDITSRPTFYSDDISDINFIKHTVFIQVKVIIDKNATRPDLAVNQQQYSEVKNRISHQLENKGLDISSLKLIFSY
jgi:hypothetical protein